MGYCIFKTYDFQGDGIDIAGLFKDRAHLFFLDSSLAQPERGRYSFIGFDPFKIVEGRGKSVLAKLKKAYEPYREIMEELPAPFSSGAVGFLSYDLGLSLEKIRLRYKPESGLPDCLFGLYDSVIAIDHLTHKLHVFSSGLPEKRKYWRQRRAIAQLEFIGKRLNENVVSKTAPEKIPYNHTAINHLSGWKNDQTKEEYFEMVKKALYYIRRGDIYQVNLAQRFTYKMGSARQQVDPLQLYRSLRMLSPSSFGAFFDVGDFQIVSSSPERFLHLDKNVLETRPMKGTRPRGKNLKGDQKLLKELEESPKDKAELLMITDLERNDLGRVCQFGSIEVKEMRTIEEYQTVFQATSKVTGILKENKNPFDVLNACFPGGSVTGCPKIRAMEVIEELEPQRRGIYTGALGYIGFSGTMDFNILIRTLLVKPRELSFYTGSGIVVDSTPQNEYQETLIKAQAMSACVSR